MLIDLLACFMAFQNHTTKPELHPLQIMEMFYATGGAFILVTLFRTTDGPVDLNMGFVHFKGASGPVIMWVIAFIAICTGMRMLNLTT